MNARTAAATLLTGALRSLATDPNIHPAFRAGLPTSPALDRAEAQILALGPVIRARRWQAIKHGAEQILNDLQAGLPFTIKRALAAPYHSEARRQVRLALRWRNLAGSLATPPTRRIVAARKAYERMGEL